MNRKWAFWFTVGIVSVVCPSRMRTQEPAVFRGHVSDSLGRAIAGVQITLSEGSRTSRTDSAGAFVFRELEPALYHVTLQRLGFAPITGTARLNRGDTVDLRFRMRAVAIQLDTVRTQVRAEEIRSGFDSRRSAGFGVFLTAADFDARPGSSLAEVLRARVGGIEILRFRLNQWAAVGTHTVQFNCGFETGRACNGMSNWPDHCYMQIIIDGIRVYEHTADNSMPPVDLASYLPSDLAAVEIYRGAAETPLEFNATGSECGTIVLWTKSGPTSSQPIHPKDTTTTTGKPPAVAGAWRAAHSQGSTTSLLVMRREPFVGSLGSANSSTDHRGRNALIGAAVGTLTGFVAGDMYARSHKPPCVNVPAGPPCRYLDPDNSNDYRVVGLLGGLTVGAILGSVLSR
jgi:hypothetical protein